MQSKNAAPLRAYCATNRACRAHKLGGFQYAPISKGSVKPSRAKRHRQPAGSEHGSTQGRHNRNSAVHGTTIKALAHTSQAYDTTSLS